MDRLTFLWAEGRIPQASHLMGDLGRVGEGRVGQNDYRETIINVSRDVACESLPGPSMLDQPMAIDRLQGPSQIRRGWSCRRSVSPDSTPAGSLIGSSSLPSARAASHLIRSRIVR